MSDEKDGDVEASDWLSQQFAPTQKVPKQDAPVQPTPPAQETQPSVPAPNAAGGFDWGLRPRSAAEPSTPTPPAEAYSPPTEPYTPPTEAYTPPTEAYSPATEPYTPPADQPTQPLSWDEFAATQAAPTSPESSAPTFGWVGQSTEAYQVQPTEAYQVPQWQQDAAIAQPEPPTEPTSAIDALFSDHQFQSYEEIGLLDTVKAAAPASVAGDASAERPPRAPLTTTQKTLMGVAGGLIVVLIVIGMFFVGQRIGLASAAAPTTTAKGKSNTPTPAGSGGPASPGVQQWTALQGGECIQPFSSAWAATFTVVSCSADHDAQMVFKGKLPDSASTAYPSESQFQTVLTGLCSAPTAINYTAAAAVTDLQISFSYPPSQSKWIAGDRTYYCFVDRQSGGNLPGDLSVAASTSSQ